MTALPSHLTLPPEALPDELPGGAAHNDALRRLEAAGGRQYANATPEERDVLAANVAVRHRLRADEAAKVIDIAGYTSAGDYLAAIPDPLGWTPPKRDPNVPLPLAAFLALTLDPPAWIVGDLIPKGPAVGGLFGAEKAGKSLAGLQLCFSVATGQDFLGHEIENPGPAIFIEYEGSEAALQRRAATIAAKYGALQPARTVELEIVHRPTHKLDTDAGQAWLTEQCAGRVLCVIGPVSKAARITKENDPTEWQRLSERLQAVADATGCTILLVHHTRKPDRTFGPPSKVADFFNSARGSNAYMGAVDVAIGVQRDPESTEGTLFYLEREGQSGKAPYTFDPSSLCVWPSDRPMTKPTAIDRKEQIAAYLALNPRSSRPAIAAAVGLSLDTTKDYVAEMLPLLVVETGAKNENLYSLRGD